MGLTFYQVGDMQMRMVHGLLLGAIEYSRNMMQI